MTKEEYKKLVSTDDIDGINLTKEDIIEWLDTIIEAKKQYMNSCYILEWGKLDVQKGEFEHSLEVCGDDEHHDVEIHIYKGIKYLAELLGVDLDNELVTYEDGSVRYKYWFDYNGTKIFELSEMGKRELK